MKRIYSLLFLILLISSNGLFAQVIKTLSPTDDTYSDGGKATQIMNSVLPEQMWVKTGSTAAFTRIGYLKFDITGITLADVGTAKLRLYCYQSDDNTVNVSVFNVVDTPMWNEGSLTWNNQPALIQPALRSKKVDSNTYVEWQITKLVQDAISQGKTSISLGINDSGATGKLFRFYTKESTNANKPQLKLNTEVENFQPLPATADALVTGGVNAGTNYASATGIQIKAGASTADSDRKGVIKFDLNQIDINKIASVGTAKLRLFFTTSNSKAANTTISIIPVANNWDESTVTWSTYPALLQATAIRSTEINVNALNLYYDFDISAYVNDKLKEVGGDGIISLGIFDLAGSKNGVTFNSKEAAGFKPVLELYEEPTNVIPQNTPVAGIFYVDAVAGNDSNDGLSMEKAWKTLDILNATTFGPGSRILFKTGQSWTGSLKLKGSGVAGSPIVIASYGQDAKPIIHGAGALETMLLENNEYVEIRNLEITNYNPEEENGISMQDWEALNVTAWYNNPAAGNDTTANTSKIGVHLTAQDKGELHHIYLVNLDIHGINGNNSLKDNGGIIMEIKGTLVPTFYNDYLVEGCHIRDVDRSGMTNVSTWDSRTLTDNGNWTPTLNFNVRNNTFERTGANALILRNALNPMIEYNLFNQCAIKDTGNAAFNFNTDGCIFQYNEACFTKANIDDEDAGGLDSDFRTKNTIIQYNYLHDNAFGMLATGGGFSTSFNDNTIFRYNIIERDGLMARTNGEKFAFKLSGNITNTTYHNNVIYLSTAQSGVDLMYHKQWLGKPSNTKYYNNIYYIEGSNHKYNVNASTGNTFSNNIFYKVGTNITVPNTDPQALSTNPLFIAVNAGPQGYKLQANSPAIASAKEILGNAPKDFFGNPVPASGTLDRGAQQYSAISAATPPSGYTKDNFDIYLLIGQSNMAGRGDIEAIDQVPLDKAYLYNPSGGWEKASVPLNKYSTTFKGLSIQKMNPGYTFARKLTEYTPHGIGLVVNARGGTSIEEWQKGYTGANDVNLYEEAVARLLASKKDGTFKGILWHQGESNQSSSSTYMAKLKQLVSDLRADLGENVFFVAGEIGQWRGALSVPMNNVIDGIATDINQASYVKSDDLKPINNDLTDPHFNGYGQRILGGLYADEILKNVYNLSPGVVSLYSKCDFKGYKLMLNPGIYNLQELQKRGFLDNDIHSLSLDAGYEALLFTGQQTGSSELISSSKNCLTGTSVNDDVSFVVIGKTGATQGMLSTIKNEKKQGTIIISPNPVKKNLKVTFPADFDLSLISKIQIVDMQGKSFKVKRSNNAQLNGSLDLDLHSLNLTSGIYVIIIETENQVLKEKIVVE